MKNSLLLIFIFCFILESNSQTINVIPQPAAYQHFEGVYEINSSVGINYDENNTELEKNATFLNEHLNKYYGINLHYSSQAKNAIRLKLVKSFGLNDEGYLLKTDKKGILITASHAAGIFYGIQTLKQLLPVPSGKSQKLTVNYIDIKDEPSFKWRGLHLDVGRHFFPVSFIKKYLDHMAMYKLNTFHWHLTEDQGWRLEIKKYPLLTEISHWREETLVGHKSKSNTYDGIGYGGFYTQDQVKDIVKYAADRHIKVIPEIEMPGHTTAVLAAYPELGCTGGPYHVHTSWGVHSDAYCAGKEKTFEFIQNVLDEVCDIFPSEYIHIGGDECEKENWEQCKLCQERIKDEGLENEEELQSYFIKRIANYLNSKGRQIIGWDEILQGGLAPGASVMSWRGEKGGISAAKSGHTVVMTPASHMYFDYYQSKDKENEPLAIGGYLPLDRVYSYNPIPKSLTKDEAKYILGAQANVWTEYMSTTKKVEYMLFPRICALSEVAWTAHEKKDYGDFEKRMNTEYKRLDQYGINYRKQD